MSEQERAKAEQAIAKAEEAKRSLGLVTKPLGDLRTRYFEMWRDSAAEDGRKREEIWYAYQATMTVERDYQGLIDAGRVAADELRNMEKTDG